jgi:multidrug efflux system outer membrane protein
MISTRALTPLMAALVLAGCANTPIEPDAHLAVPTAFKEAQTAVQPPAGWKIAEPQEAQARGPWWAGFADPTLNRLLQQAQDASPSLAAAAARVQSARSALRGSESSQLPQVGLNLGVSRQKPGAAEQGLPAQFDAAATEASYQSVLLALQADVAQAYFQLRTLDADVDVLTRGLKLREQTLQLIDKRRAAGDVSELDVARARTDLATTRAELQGLRGTRARTEHALALLLGQAPAAFQLPPAPLAIDARVPAVPPGLPSSLLERRPDVVAAQARMRAASARVGQAHAALFPALVLTAQGGGASYELRDLFEWSSRSWLTSAVLSLPLFDGGRNRALITQAEAQLAESVATYRQSVLQAFGDVEGQLSNLSSLREQTASLDDALMSARRSADLADKRYRAGEDNYLTLLDAQRSLLTVERQALQLRGAWASNTVGLVRALGGHW